MALNVIVLAFILFMAYWWSDQGLFSALIHLVLTVLAALLALAVWEPIVYGLLMNYVPDMAWGIGLLGAFGIILFFLRYLSDRLIRGNLAVPDLANKVGGGLCGLLAGTVTAGMLLIGLQMIGTSGPLGYQSYRLAEGGGVETTGALWVPADTLTSSLLERFGGGSFAPIGGTPLTRVHPDLATEAAFYAQAAFPQSRRAVHPANVSIPEGGYYLLSDAPKKLARDAPGTGRLALVATEIKLQPAERAGAADEDAIFRATKNQIALVGGAGPGKAGVQHPVGYIQSGEFRKLGLEGDYAYSRASVSSTIHYWVFRVPANFTPRFLRLKQTRIPLPAQPIESTQAASDLLGRRGGRVASASNGGGNNGGGNGGNNGGQPGAPQRTSGPGGAVADSASVSDRLPFVINKNQLSNVDVVDGAIRSGHDRVSEPQQYPGKNLAVRNVYHNRNASIVQVNLGKNEPQSLLGKIFSTATRNTQAPVLVDQAGRTYFAVGYGIVNGEFRFGFNPNRPVRALSQIKGLGSASAKDSVILYYQVPQGITITQFKLGGTQSQSLNLAVPSTSGNN